VREQGQPGRFTPNNDAAKNLWYWRDIAGLTASAFPDGNVSVLPFIVDQEASASPGDGPRGGTTIVTLTNRHLEYAITWYGLTFTLAGIFAVFAAGRLRAKNS
jgi:surfeit locus 1 family protein